MLTKKLKTTVLFGLILVSLSAESAFAAATKDLSIPDNSVNFSTGNFTEGKQIRIYASVSNSSSSDLLGTVRFTDNGKQIGGDQAISVLKNKTDDVFIDWVPSYGSHRVMIKIIPWDTANDDPSNNTAERTVFVQQDTDHDGITNDKDDDDDGDGTPDKDDAFPLDSKESADTDGDGIGNNKDTDDDNDGVPDSEDAMPLDPNETMDSDKDAIGEIADSDDDNDGLSDTEEIKTNTSSTKADTDGDKINDKLDPFPLDPAEWEDTDQDGIGNNKDLDDDNDGMLDGEDKFPLNKAPTIRVDNFSTAGINEETILDASSSLDNDGKIISFKWLIDGTTNLEGEKVKYIFTTLGEHKIQLTIEDDKGESATKDFEIQVINARLYNQLLVILIILILGSILTYKYIADGNLKNLKKLFSKKK